MLTALAPPSVIIGYYEFEFKAIDGARCFLILSAFMTIKSIISGVSLFEIMEIIYHSSRST